VPDGPSPLPAAVAPAAEALRPAPDEPAGAAPTWPCRCGTAVAWEQPRCPGCGAGFLDDLAGAGHPRLVVPGVGDLGRLGRRGRFLLTGALAFLLAPAPLVLILLADAVL
jgi:hypothetical protein